jgi:hypothetical protein
LASRQNDFIIGALVSAITSGVLFLWPAISWLWSRADKPKEKPATQSTDTASKTVTTRVAFSETQSIKHWPPFLGGSHTLRLDNVATLRFHHPSSPHSVTLLLDVVPTDLAVQTSPGVSVDGAVMYRHAATTAQYLFDTDQNKRREIAVAGRTFLVTLLQIKRPNVAEVPNALEYVFGVSEK